MRLLLLADGAVGEKIASFLMESYVSDLSLIVTTRVNDIYLAAESKGIPVCVFDSDDSILRKLDGGVDLGILA